eukprot:Ihof_evm3s110 gene=Ihof_evmTU3s110
MFTGWKTMASSLVQTAVDSLAPTLKPNYEQFIDSWRFITNYYVQQIDTTVPLRDTEIPFYLDTMLAIMREEEVGDGETTGPCLEYLLQHKILETLCSLGQGDVPVGMKQQVLRFFRDFLLEIKQPTIPHINVHRPIKRLVRSCHHRRSHPLEEDYIKFVCIIISLLRDNPKWAGFFIDSLSESDQKKAKGRCSGDKEFFLFEALTDLLSSEDANVCNQACIGLLDCVDLASPDVTKYLIGGCRFPTVLVGRLVDLFEALPLTLLPNGAKKEEGLKLRRSLRNFTTWAEYLNDVVLGADKEVANHIAGILKDTMLEKSVTPRLTAPAEDQAYATTFYLTAWISRINSDVLLDVITCYLIGKEQFTPEHVDDKESHQLRRVLVGRCESLSPQLTLSTLRLFETLLHHHSRHSMTTLVLRNFSQGQIKPQPSDHLHQLYDVMQAWLSLVPDVASSNDFNNDRECYSYYADAQAKVRELDSEILLKRWGDMAILDNQEPQPFYEGDLLHTLLRKIEKMLHLPYEEILLVTGLLALLATYPISSLHTYMLDPFFTPPNSRPCLYSSLRMVSKEIQLRAASSPNFKEMVVTARQIVTGTILPTIDEPPEIEDHRKMLE